jgi:hypothetical protein
MMRKLQGFCVSVRKYLLAVMTKTQQTLPSTTMEIHMVLSPVTWDFFFVQIASQIQMKMWRRTILLCDKPAKS